jgi:4a-hydroxytetrahydrobiopterin dehydratase
MRQCRGERGAAAHAGRSNAGAEVAGRRRRCFSSRRSAQDAGPADARNCREKRHMAHKILTDAEIKSELKNLKDWSVKGSNIEASFDFQTFRDAISFIVQIAIEAEAMNHHPEFFNSYNKVSFSFCTHDVGNKITDADVEIARKISHAARRFLSMK